MKRARVTILAVLAGAGLAGGQTTDLEIVTANLGRETCATNGETLLYPALRMTPPRKTLLAGGEQTVTASGSTNPITWFTIHNRSGCTLTPGSSTSAVYQAGATSAVVDVIEAWDGYNMFARGYFNVIGEGDLALSGKAIIVAGTKGPSDSVWTTTDYLASRAYNTLLYRAFSKTNIYYLSQTLAKDADDNKLNDDVDALATYVNVSNTFNHAVVPLDRLFVYLVDHGEDSSGQGYFRLNAGEVLPAADLDAWLDRMQDAYSNDVVVVVDCCYAGSFVDELAYTGAAKRIVVAACGANEPTYFVAGGLVSFSDAFFSGVLLGLSVGECFEQARGAMAGYQGAMMDDDKNGLYQAGVDGAAAGATFVGATFVAGKDIPQIGLVLGNQLLHGATMATLWADDVVSDYAIARVWALIVPPGHDPNPSNPVSDLIELDLAYDDADGRYEAEYNGFSQEGTYRVMYYAKDEWESVSLPKSSYVTQDGFDERIVIVAGGETGDVRWVTTDAMAGMTYHTCRSRRFDAGSICYLSAETNQYVDKDETNDWDGLPTLANLEWAVRQWAATTNFGGPADMLSVYLVGDETNGQFRMNGSEALDAATLAGWLDEYQATGGEACVVLEYPKSGGAVAGLRPPTGKVRIAVASSGPAQVSCRGNGGLLSFSRYFLSYVFEGFDIWTAYAGARDAIYASSGIAQQAALEADWTGGWGTRGDGNVAKTRYIGTAFRTGADTPAVGAVTPDTVLAGSNTLTLWAEDVTDMDGISNVWCLVTPPGFDGEGDVPEVALAAQGGGERYEGVYEGFTNAGRYVCTVQAVDNSGEMSAPVQFTVDTGDAYEPDDTSEAATWLAFDEAQAHNLHGETDEDWVVFFGATGTVYRVEARQTGTNVDVAVEAYYREWDGTLTKVAALSGDDFGTGTGVAEHVDVDLKTDPGARAGLYCVRVRPSEYSPGAWGADSGYEVTVTLLEGGGTYLAVAALDVVDGQRAPAGAYAVVEGNGGSRTQYFGAGSTVAYTELTPGTYTVRVPAPAGYWATEDPKTAGKVGDASEWNVFGNPKSKPVDGTKYVGCAFMFYPMVEAQAVVRDTNTGARVGGASIRFKTYTGKIAGFTYSNYQNTAWGTAWQSRADGTMPSDGGGLGVKVPAAQCDLIVSNGGYVGVVVSNVFAGAPAAGVQTNLGTVWLRPVDGNGNGIADDWEAKHFPGGMGSPTNDTDHDGSPDGDEYGAGTDPTNAASVLGFDGSVSNLTDGFRVEWDSVPWHTYRVRGTNDLMGAWPWPALSPDLEATQAQYRMSWLDASATGKVQRFYRVDAVLP